MTQAPHMVAPHRHRVVWEQTHALDVFIEAMHEKSKDPPPRGPTARPAQNSHDEGIMRRTAKRTRPVAAKSAVSELHPVKRSWTALLAATALGVAGASMLHADIKSDAWLDDTRTYRLIVQSYDHSDGASLDPVDRPVASVQREVTAEELRLGVRVGLLEFRQGRWDADALVGRVSAHPVVLAWIEEGKADLELDGLRARPQPGSLRGTSPRTVAQGTVHISVRDPSNRTGRGLA